MLLPRFKYHQPATMGEALETLAELGGQAKVLAGGTDLLVNLKTGRDSAREVVSIHGLKNLAGLRQTKKGLKVGALTTATDLAAAVDMLGAAKVLGLGAGMIGSPLIRNRATVGGNIVSARPAADTAPPLMVLGAKALLSRKGGTRTLALEDFFKGPGETAMEPGELLTGFLIPSTEGRCGGGYQKLGARKALEISIVNVAAFLALDEDGFVTRARIAMGAVGPVPLRATAAENLIEGEKPKGPNDPIFMGAALAGVGNSCAIDDHRGSADYRCRMVEVLTRRALAQAYSAAVEG